MDWNEISVRKYYDILEILLDETDPVNLNVRLIDTIWDINSADIPVAKFSYYMNELKFLRTPYKPLSPKKYYTVEGKDFCPTMDVSKITTAQYIDFQALAKKEDHKNILNILFIEKDKEYGDADNSELLWEKLPMTAYSDVLFFFLRLLNKLTKDTLRSSLNQMKKMYRKEKNEEKKKELMEQMVNLKLALSQVNEDGWSE